MGDTFSNLPQVGGAVNEKFVYLREFFILKRTLVVYTGAYAYMLWSLLPSHPYPVSAAVPCPQKSVKPLGSPSGAVLSRQGVYTVCGSLHTGLPLEIIPVRAGVAYALPPRKREGLRKWVHGILVPVCPYPGGKAPPPFAVFPAAPGSGAAAVWAAAAETAPRKSAAQGRRVSPPAAPCRIGASPVPEIAALSPPLPAPSALSGLQSRP